MANLSGDAVHALDVRDLSVSYGGVHALNRVSLTVDPGHLVGLVGPNGAGKTTLIDAVAGMVPSSGAVWLRSSRVDSAAPHARVQRGISRTFQTLELFEDLTVMQNLLCGAEMLSSWSAILDVLRPRRDAGIMRNAVRCMDILDIGPYRHQRPGSLPLGVRKLVTVARALATSPAVLLLDEPAAGLDSAEGRALGRKLRLIADDGIGVLLVDHDIDLILSICDVVYVLDFGSVIANGSPSAIASDPNVIAAYIGHPAGAEPGQKVDTMGSAP